MSAKFRQFKVINKVQESRVVTSFYLKPVDDEPLWPAVSGQYLTLRIPSEHGPVLRMYSLSHDVTSCEDYRITVKREAAPLSQSSVPEGVASCWLHDQVEVGHLLEVAAPRGVFVLDKTSQRPIVLLSGGVGQTPLLAMLHTLVKTPRDVWYLHACEAGDVHAMQAEVADLVAQGQGRIHRHTVYRQPTIEDRALGGFDSEGFIDKALLQSLLPLDDYDIYLCGPAPFMVAMYSLLTDLGIATSRIAYEFFGKARSLDALVADAAQAATVKTPAIAASKAPGSLANLAFITNPDAWAVAETALLFDDNAEHVDRGSVVHFSRSGLTVNWSSENKSLLELAESSGLTPDYSCRSGICNSCKLPLLEGEVSYFEEPLESLASDEVLLCCSRPRGRVVIDL